MHVVGRARDARRRLVDLRMGSTAAAPGDGLNHPPRIASVPCCRFGTPGSDKGLRIAVAFVSSLFFFGICDRQGRGSEGRAQSCARTALGLSAIDAG